MKYIDIGTRASIINLDNEITSAYEKRLLDLSKNLVHDGRKALILDFSSVRLLPPGAGVHGMYGYHAAAAYIRSII